MLRHSPDDGPAAALGPFRTVPEAYRDRALTACLKRAIHPGPPPESIIEARRALGSDPSASTADVAFIHIRQSRLDDREDGTSMHARLGTRSLASLPVRMVGWDHLLKALEELAFETWSKPVAERRAVTPPVGTGWRGRPARNPGWYNHRRLFHRNGHALLAGWKSHGYGQTDDSTTAS